MISSRRGGLVFLVLLLLGACQLIPTAQSIRLQQEPIAGIGLLGDSNTNLGFLPEEQQLKTLLGNALGVTVDNFALGGATTKDFLSDTKGTLWQQSRSKYYLISFGLNDVSRYSARAFKDYTRDLINQVEGLGGIPILITGPYFDYPEHYCTNENARMQPYYDAYRTLSKEFNLHLIDAYAHFETLAWQGNWDVRIRNTGGPPFVLDDARDEQNKAQGCAWFENVHYNPVGSRELSKLIVSYFEDKGL